MRWARSFSTRDRRSAEPSPGRAQLGPDLAREPGVLLGPKPFLTRPSDRDPGGVAPGADDHSPVLAVGVGRVRAHLCDIDPGDEGGIGGQRGLDFLQRGDLARDRAIILDQLGLELTQGDAGKLALALLFRKPLCPLGVIKFLGGGFRQLVEPLQFRGQIAEAGSLGG